MNQTSQLPDFFILGATKCGTSSLHHYLQQHPQIFLPYVKELGFFKVPEETFQSGLESYLEYFADAGTRKTGEATPGYFQKADVVPARMKELYGSNRPPRFILVFRDPVERAFSHYLHRVRAGEESHSFRDALRYEREHPKQSRKNWKSYYGDGIYADALETWFEYFPRDHFVFLLTQDLAEDTDAVVRRLCEFLDVDPEVDFDTGNRKNQAGTLRFETIKNMLFHPPSWLHSLVTTLIPQQRWRRRIRWFVRELNKKPYDERPTMNPAVEEELRERYQPHIRRLEELIERDLSAWTPEVNE